MEVIFATAQSKPCSEVVSNLESEKSDKSGVIFRVEFYFGRSPVSSRKIGAETEVQTGNVTPVEPKVRTGEPEE